MQLLGLGMPVNALLERHAAETPAINSSRCILTPIELMDGMI